MPVFLLEIRACGDTVLEEVHASEHTANLSLLEIVQGEWDAELMGRTVESVSATDAVSLFFDVMEDFSYSVRPLKIQGGEFLQAPPQPDPFPGMEPVPLEALEVQIISCCLKMVSPAEIKKYNAYLLGNYSTDVVQKAQRSAIKKMS